MYEQAKKWYGGLPWYWKVLGFVVLVGLALLWILQTFWKDGTRGGNTEWADPGPLVDGVSEDFREDDAELTKKIEEKKAEIVKSLKQAERVDNKVLVDRKRIENATTLEELIRLQEELGL